ncbi:hypothetical protein CWC19_19075 [Pseudoalteromonas aurantia]|uniref:Uncharacterized protein n=1 Tax=Pseudoalteromonas aurantia TaxID=43654 RepID=A0A5S3UZW8_9GAMM|nr:hypothetical protein CWC19_19075 [Pseudoalteromonas aurantia]
MIYEISFFDYRTLFFLPFFVVITLFSRYVYTNELLSVKQKRKAVSIFSLLFGLIPLILIASNVSAKVSYLLGDYKTYKSYFNFASNDGRHIKLVVGSSTFKYDQYQARCLNKVPKIKKGDLIEVKYFGFRQKACILSIESVKGSM